MRLGLVAALMLVLCLLPHASAQVPDPQGAILLACDTAAGIEPQARQLIPVCPDDEPPAPAANEPGAPPPPAAAEPAEEAQQLADAIVDEVDEIPEDPASAPGRLLAIVDLIVRFVRDLLDVPVKLGDATATRFAEVSEAVAGAQQATKDRIASAKDAVSSAVSSTVEKVKSLFDRPVEAPSALPKAPVRAPVETPSLELPLDGLRRALADA